MHDYISDVVSKIQNNTWFEEINKKREHREGGRGKIQGEYANWNANSSLI